MNALETAWDRVAALSPNPPVWVVQLAALIAVIIVLEPHLWRIARNVVTIAHEGAHLIVAVLVGRRLKVFACIRIRRVSRFRRANRPASASF